MNWILHRMLRITSTALGRAHQRVLKVSNNIHFPQQKRMTQEGAVEPKMLRHNQYAIVVTTHSRRFSRCLSLVKMLSERLTNHINIYIVINADTWGPFDPKKRSQFLRELTKLDRVFPVCFGKPQGMSSLWNTGLRLADSDTIFVLQDDLFLEASTIQQTFDSAAEILAYEKMLLLNESFGSFGIRYSCLQEVGWFDERFVGFGEEDVDYSSRFLSEYGKCIPSLSVAAFNNESSEVGYEEIIRGKGKYSLFNKVFMELKYYKKLTEGEKYAWGHSKIATPDFYPGESFLSKHRHLLNEINEEEISRELLESLNGPTYNRYKSDPR